MCVCVRLFGLEALGGVCIGLWVCDRNVVFSNTALAAKKGIDPFDPRNAFAKVRIMCGVLSKCICADRLTYYQQV